MLVSGDRFCPDCGAVQEATGPNASPSVHSSAWDAVVRVLRSSLAGEYRITRELGRGGQAAVFLADELALNRQVAIKVLAPGNVSGERQVELFKREAQTVANLKHPHIVTMYSVRQIEDLHLFVMQFIEGRSLAAIIADRGPLPLTAIRAVAFQIGNALQYAHRRNVIHRDVKPANVLFDEDGNAILTDFGIAKDASNNSNSGTLTASFMGTAAYMSPEQCQQRPATWATDQYSLGVLLYEMLTGTVPFDGSQFAVMLGHTDREPPSIRAVRGDCPVELEWAVMRMLAKRPEDRWPSIPDALAALGAGPLTRDDPIRGELKRLARWAVADGSARPPRLTLRVPEQLEIGESAPCEVFSIGATDTVPQRVTATWQVDDPVIADCDAKSGLLKGLAIGSTVVRAETANGKVEADVNVVQAAVRDIQFTLARATVTVGDSVSLACDVRDRRGTRLNVPVLWNVTEPAVADVTENGVLTALAAGMTSVIVRAGDVTAERSLFVQEADAASLVIAGGRSPLIVPETLMLSASVFDVHGKLLPSREVRWKSSDVRVASVDRYGVVRGVSMGDVFIIAQSGSASAEMQIAVHTAPVHRPLAYAPGPVDLGMQLVMSDSKDITLPKQRVEAGDYSSAADSTANSSSTPRSSGAIDSDWDSGNKTAASIRSGVLRKVALVLVPLLVVGLSAWRFSVSRAERIEMARSNAISAYAPAAIEVMRQSTRSFANLIVDEQFSDSIETENISISGGVLTIKPPNHGSTSGNWNAGNSEFAVHLNVTFVPGRAVRQGGVRLSSSDGTMYYVALYGPSPAGYQISQQKGAAVSLVKSAVFKDMHPDHNAMDLLWIDGSLTVFINGVRAASEKLSAAPSAEIGVMVGDSNGVMFDNLVITTLKHD